MFIESLQALNFRNLQRCAIELGERTVVIEGPNGHGKTNLLEALYLCATGKSFRAAKPGQMLGHGCTAGWVKARLRRQGVRHEVEVVLGARSRGMRVDGRAVRRISALLDLVNVVAFFPDDLRIVKGSPEERRQFLDRSVANHRRGFVDASLAYGKALKSRNALLRGERVDRGLVEVYDAQLIEHGRVLTSARVETLAALASAAERYFGRVMGEGRPQERGEEGRLGLRVISGVPDDGDDDAFAAALRASFPRDRSRGFTTLGPHRADLDVSLDGQSARVFASQGQQRAIILALKMAEVESLARRLQSPPILLLDDVSSELDAQRTRLLFEEIDTLACQVWVSTTGAAPLPVAADSQRWRIQDGLLTAISS